MCLKGKCKVSSRGFCLFDSEAEQQASKFSSIFSLNETITTQQSNKQNPRDRTLDLLFILRYKHMIPIKSHLSLA